MFAKQKKNNLTSETFKVLYGDVDGSNAINMRDVTELQKAVAQLIQLSNTAFKASDVNADGIVSMIDVVLIQQYIAEIITEFKAGKEFEVDEEKLRIEAYSRLADYLEEIDYLWDAYYSNDKGNWTEDSYDVFKKAYDSAKTVVLDFEASQEEYENAYNVLSEADKALKINFDNITKDTLLDNLKALYSNTGSLNISDGPYTKETFEAYAASRKNAEDVIDSPEKYTKEEIWAVTDALYQAYYALQIDIENMTAAELADYAKEQLEYYAAFLEFDKLLTAESFEPFKKAYEALSEAADSYSTYDTEEFRALVYDFDEAAGNLEWAEEAPEAPYSQLLAELVESIKNSWDTNYGDSQKFTAESYEPFINVYNISVRFLESEAVNEVMAETIYNALYEAEGKLSITTEELILQLEALYNELSSIKQEDGPYTEDTYNNLTSALENAKKVIDSLETCSREEIISVINELTEAKNGLETETPEPVYSEAYLNLEDYLKLVSYGWEYYYSDKDYFEADTYEAFMNAYNAAVAVYQSENPTDEDLIAAYTALKAADEGLKADVTGLTADQLIARLEKDMTLYGNETYENGPYTEETWNRYVTALEEVKKVLADPSSYTKIEIRDVGDELYWSFMSLEYVPVSDSDTTDTETETDYDGTETDTSTSTDTETESDTDSVDPLDTDVVFVPRGEAYTVGELEDFIYSISNDTDTYSNDDNYYTADSFAGFEQALSNAKLVLENESSSQDEISQAYVSLKKACRELTPDFSEWEDSDVILLTDSLSSSITNFGGMIQSSGPFSDESYQKYLNACNHAQDVYYNYSEYTFAEINEAENDLIYAYEDLEYDFTKLTRLEVIERLNSEFETCGMLIKYCSEIYTANSIARLQENYDACTDMTVNPDNYTKAELIYALREISYAVNAVVPV